MTLLPPVSGASGGSMYSVMPPSQCNTLSNLVNDERKPLRDTLRAVSVSPLTLESGVETANKAFKPGNTRGNTGASRVKKTVLLGVGGGTSAIGRNGVAGRGYRDRRSSLAISG